VPCNIFNDESYSDFIFEKNKGQDIDVLAFNARCCSVHQLYAHAALADFGYYDIDLSDIDPNDLRELYQR